MPVRFSPETFFRVLLQVMSSKGKARPPIASRGLHHEDHVRHGVVSESVSCFSRKAKSKEIHMWNEAEIAMFERRWPVGTRERLTFSLLVCTGSEDRTCIE